MTCSVAFAAGTPDPAPADGAMVIRVLSNVSSSGGMFRNRAELDVTRMEDEAAGNAHAFRLLPGVAGASHSAVFGAVLPTGHYRLARLYSEGCGWHAPCIASWINIKTSFSTFEVRAGRLTDLGVLVQTALPGAKADYWGAHQVDPPHEQTAALVKRLTPDLSRFLDQPPLGWDASSVVKDMPRLFARAIQDSFGIVSPAAIDGGFIAGSLNGVVREWRADGTSIAHDTGERVALETVVAGDGQWLAGGEFDTVLRSIDRGEHWTSLRGDLPDGLVGDLASWHGRVVATLLHGKTVTIEALQEDGASAGPFRWVALADYPLKLDASAAWKKGERPRSLLAGDRLVTSLPPDHLAVLDLPKGRAELHEAPGDIDWMSVTADGALLLRTQGDFFGFAVHRSTDLGAHWQKVSDAGGMRPPAVRAGGQGVGYRGGFAQVMGKIVDGRCMATDDGGATWSVVDKTTEQFRQFVYSADGKTAFAITADDAIWTSDDDGRHWTQLP